MQMTEHHLNGSPASQITIELAGKQIKPPRMWFDNGNLKSENYWSGVKLEGPAKLWHSNGNLKQSGVLVEGQLNGLVRSFFSNGQLQQEVEYAYGVEEGVIRRWYPSGKKTAGSHHSSR